jgi:hypothetical protein
MALGNQINGWAGMITRKSVSAKRTKCAAMQERISPRLILKYRGLKINVLNQ